MEGLDHNCLKTRKEFFATADKPFHFVDSGLPNVYLVGIKHFRCECGSVVAEIPAIKQLLTLIARRIIAKPETLTGAEIRFLRKRLGQKAVEFARYVSVEPETLSRIENDRQAAGEGTDNFIRIYYFLASEDQVLTEARKAVIDQLRIRKTSPKASKKLVARVKDNEWEAAA